MLMSAWDVTQTLLPALTVVAQSSRRGDKAFQARVKHLTYLQRWCRKQKRSPLSTGHHKRRLRRPGIFVSFPAEEKEPSKTPRRRAMAMDKLPVKPK